MIFHRVDAEGGFVCGESDSRITAYAYPTSEHARQAGRGMAYASKVATEMLERETAFREILALRPDTSAYVKAQDDRNWVRLTVRSSHRRNATN
jgi:hypothetical protein